MLEVKSQVLGLATNMVSQLVYYRNGMERQKNIAKVIKIKGHRIWYQDIGQGQPILFLHGLGSNSLSWLMTVPMFCQQYRVIAIDNIGHGRSDKPDLDYKITDFVNYVEGFLDTLNLKEIYIVGNSLGGWIAARLALRRPELIKRLVLVCSAGLQPWPELREKLEKVKFAPRTISETRSMLSLCFYNKVQYVNQVSVVISYLLRNLESNHKTVERVLASALDPNEWLDDKLTKIRAETLVLWGQHDELMPIEFARQFATNIPNAKLEIISNCGHVPQIERPKEFNQLLKNFL